MQVETVMRYQLTSVRTAINEKDKKITNVGEDVEKGKLMHWCTCGGHVR